MAAAIAIPGPGEVTAQWLTTCLRASGHPRAEVRRFTARNIGTGQIGQCVRYELDYVSPDPSYPERLVGKFASDDPVSSGTGVALRNYYREVRFYEHLAEKLSMRIPRCYFAAIEGEGPRFALLLEDMYPAEQGNQLAGCSATVAKASVLELVGMQAPSWCDESLRQFDWLVPPPSATPPPETSNLYAQLLPGFLERFSDRLTPEQARIIAQVADSPNAPVFAPTAGKFCLEHVDYRLDNMLIDETQDPPQVTVVDWQSVKLGKPLNDVAYFLGAGLLPEVRREVEEDIVRSYHSALLAAGIQDFGWDECWSDYRKGTFSGFAVTVVASMIVQRTERGDDMFTVMAQRHSQHALDLGAEEFLS